MDKMIAKYLEYLDTKKQDFLKKKVKVNSTEKEIIAFNKEADDKFLMHNWLIDASNRAGQLSVTTHPPKFSHPDAKIDAIIAKCNQKNDGLLRSGNIKVGLDVVGNAASLDVNKFLHLELDNNLTILQNLEQNTDYIKTQFEIDNFDEIRSNFLKIKKSGLTTKSSDKLKQIYFPVGDDYHLLSLLTPSAIVYKLKQRINENFQPFSERNKQEKEKVERAVKDKKELKGDLNSIWNLTAIGYGGTKPQNISVLNNQNGGIAYLLSSMPPILQKRKTQPPKKDFFSNIWLNNYLKEDFKELHGILNNRQEELAIKRKIEKENKPYRSIRAIRDELIIPNIIFQIKKEIEKIREISDGWSDSSAYNKLPQWQKILLDNQYESIRDDNEQNHDFLNHARLELAIWFSKTYNKLFDKNLGDIEIVHIKDVLKNEMEVFK